MSKSVRNMSVNMMTEIGAAVMWTFSFIANILICFVLQSKTSKQNRAAETR